MATPCITQHQVNQLWNYAREEYVNKPDYKGFEWLIKQLSADIKENGGKLTPDEVARTLSLPKSVRNASFDMYRQQANRLHTLADARAFTEGFDKSEVRKALTALFYLPSAFKVVGHTTALMGTHAWRYAFRPTQWVPYGRAIIKSFEAMSPARAERIRQSIVTDPMFSTAAKPGDYVNMLGQTKKNGGLAVDPTMRYDDVQKYAHKLFGPLGRMTDNAFLGLKWFRLEQFKRRWDALPDDLKTEKMRGLIQMSVNHSTGATPELHIPEGVRMGVFAPGLETSRWQSLVFDPIRTMASVIPPIELGGRTILKGGSPEARYIALRRVGAAAEMAATYYVLSKTAEAFSGNAVNLSDPSKPDFALFRFGKRLVNYTGGMAHTIRTALSLAPPDLVRQATGNVINPMPTREPDSDSTIGRYVRSKLSPTVGGLYSMYTGKTFMGQPMPWMDQKIGKKGQPIGKPPIGWGELANEQFGPLLISEAIHEAVKTMEEQGVPITDSQVLANSLVPMIVSMFGGHTYVEEPKKEK